MGIRMLGGRERPRGILLRAISFHAIDRNRAGGELPNPGLATVDAAFHIRFVTMPLAPSEARVCWPGVQGFVIGIFSPAFEDELDGQLDIRSL